MLATFAWSRERVAAATALFSKLVDPQNFDAVLAPVLLPHELPIFEENIGIARRMDHRQLTGHYDLRLSLCVDRVRRPGRTCPLASAPDAFARPCEERINPGPLPSPCQRCSRSIHSCFELWPVFHGAVLTHCLSSFTPLSTLCPPPPPPPRALCPQHTHKPTAIAAYGAPTTAISVAVSVFCPPKACRLVLGYAPSLFCTTE